MTEERDKNEFKETENKAGQQPTGQKKPGETETDKQADRTSGQGTDKSTDQGFIGSQASDKDDSETGQPARSPDKKTDVEQGSGAA